MIREILEYPDPRLREVAKRWDTPARVPRLPAFEVESDYEVRTEPRRRRAVA